MTRILDVGYDLDGVNFWFDRAYYAGCLEIGMIPAGVAHTPAERWEFYENYDHPLPTFLSNCDVLADLGLLWDGDMIPGAATAWDDLIDAGHRIHVKTDRPFGSHPVASEVGTYAWLRKHKRRYHSITFSADKSDGPRCDVMLEDKLANYDALAKTSCLPVLINRPWNQVPADEDFAVVLVPSGSGHYAMREPRRRVNTHDGFVALVAAMAEDTVDA